MHRADQSSSKHAYPNIIATLHDAPTLIPPSHHLLNWTWHIVTPRFKFLSSRRLYRAWSDQATIISVLIRLCNADPGKPVLRSSQFSCVYVSSPYPSFVLKIDLDVIAEFARRFPLNDSSW